MIHLLVSALLAVGLLATDSQPASTLPAGIVTSTPAPPADFASLKSQLRDKDDRKRREAVKGLIELDTEEAWELVIDALADPVAQVADEAQIGLSELPEGLHKDLFGKRGLASKKEIVALRVAEVLGRMHVTFSDKEYAKALGHKDAEVRRSALWSLERLAKRGMLNSPSKDLLKQLNKLLRKDKQDAVQAQALVTIAALDESAVETLVLEFAFAKSPLIRAAAMELTRGLPAFGLIQVQTLVVNDPAFAVRLIAYESANAQGSLAAMRFLVEALGKEQRARCAWRIVDFLRGSTGMKYGLDPRPWSDWLSQQPEGWTAQEKKERQAAGEEGTTALVGMRVISSYLTFLIDFSGSMWKETAGVSLKQKVDVEMRKALEGLAPEVMFNVQPYATDSVLWEKKLTPASERNVKQAMDFFEGCKLTGKGDFWSAMQIAMLDPEVDTFMLLGDGAPTGGQRWNMELMKSLFAHENRFRRIALDALLMDCSGFLTSQWEVMCEQSGGRCMSVEIQ